MIPWTRLERRWLHALLGAMIPRAGGLAPARPGLADLEPSGFDAAFAAAAPPLLGLGVRTATWALTFAAPLLLGRLATFGGLEPAARDALLVRAAASRSFLLRQLVLTLKLAACFAYFRVPAARARFEPAPPGAPPGATP